MKKVILLNGSPRQNGNTAIALAEVASQLEKHGIQTQTIWIGNGAVRGCIACGGCGKTGKCVFDDEVNATAEALRNADALVVGSPVYYGSANGSVCSFLDRLFHSAARSFDGKLGASVVVCRRGGASAAFDRLNKYFTISNMPVVSSQYWNSVHGGAIGEALQDAEGLQTMRTLADNMAWMLENLDTNAHPQREPHAWTNFIR